MSTSTLRDPASIEALQEFKVQTESSRRVRARYDSDQCFDQAGTNQFHGTLFEFLRNDKLDAKTVRLPASARRMRSSGISMVSLWRPRNAAQAV